MNKEIRSAWAASPPSVDFHKRVFAAYEREFCAQRATRNAIAVAGLVFAVLIMGLFGALRSKNVPQSISLDVPSLLPPATRLSVPAATVKATHSKHHRKSNQATRSPQVLNGFFSLMDSPPPLGRGALVRVLVSAAMMRDAGFRLDENKLDDELQADILIGEDGSFRAIRFVNEDIT